MLCLLWAITWPLVDSAAELLKACFSYTVESPYVSVGGHVSIQEAFLIFDTDLQEMKVTQFLDTKPWGLLSHSRLFADERTIKVTRRDGSSPVRTLAELFDFEKTQWAATSSELSDGVLYYRNLEVQHSGTWLKEQFDEESVSEPWSVTGEIVSYEPWSGRVKAELSLDTQRLPGYLFVDAESEMGFGYTLWSSPDLETWNQVESPYTHSLFGRSLQDRIGGMIGTGHPLGLDFIQLDQDEGPKFFKLMVAPLEYENL